MRRVVLPGFLAILFITGFAASWWLSYKPGQTHTEGRPLIGGPFTLVNTQGKRVSDRDFRGKLMLVFFGYTHCPDVCPTELQTMGEVLGLLGAEADRIAPLFISVDPKRDTPEVLSNYVKSFSDRIEGLTGDAGEIASAAKSYRVYFRKASGTDSDEYTVDHSTFVYLMDEEGKYLTHFSFNTSPSAMADVIKKHIRGSKSALLRSRSTKDEFQ